METPLLFGTPVGDSHLAPPLVLLTDPQGCAKSLLVRAPTARAPLVTSGIEPRSPSNSPHLSVQTDQDFQPSRHDAAPLSTRTPVGQSSGRTRARIQPPRLAKVGRVRATPSSTTLKHPCATAPHTSNYGPFAAQFFFAGCRLSKIECQSPRLCARGEG
jgi:hypothetical protein